MEEEGRRIALALAALYARGLPRPQGLPRARWVAVEQALRKGPGPAAEALAGAGLWAESIALQQPGLIEKASEFLSLGRLVTAFCPGYPRGWLRLGTSAPAVVWAAGARPIPDGESLTVVGSRDIAPRTRSLARAVGAAIAEQGFILVSGGATGCDRESASGAKRWASRAGVAAPVIEVIPYGIGLAPCRCKGYESPLIGASLSVAGPNEGFSSALAMERNGLLYGASVRSLVVSCRFREGGTWKGAAEALRRRSSQIWVWADGTPGARGLEALGAIPTRSIEAFVAGDAPSAALFA